MKVSQKEMCPILKCMNLLGKKWILMIIKAISDGCKSYSEIEKNIQGVNPRTLSERLKELQTHNLVEKKILCEEPKRCIYCLTKTGESLSKHIDELSAWAEKNFHC
ncbi:helix-turn-helix transcriptional regulator [Candidatus Gracilibacteria bacterium]|nr:helix-turn-helix transcriptional regulator [Candidatus Gracilibacteria bacterium]